MLMSVKCKRTDPIGGRYSLLRGLRILLSLYYSILVYITQSGAADSGGQEGQPPLLTQSRRGKTIFLPLHLADFAG